MQAKKYVKKPQIGWLTGKLSAKCSQFQEAKDSSSGSHTQILCSVGIHLQVELFFFSPRQQNDLSSYWTASGCCLSESRGGNAEWAWGACVDDLTAPAPSCHIWKAAKPQDLGGTKRAACTEQMNPTNLECHSEVSGSETVKDREWRMQWDPTSKTKF